MSDEPLHTVLEDAIWQALDSEQGMPHSGVDPSFVIPEFLRLLDKGGYTIVPKEKPTPALPEFITVTSRTGTSARWWCDNCDWGGGWVSPREAFDGACGHAESRHADLT